jgi:hypothetical protein
MFQSIAGFVVVFGAFAQDAAGAKDEKLRPNCFMSKSPWSEVKPSRFPVVISVSPKAARTRKGVVELQVTVTNNSKRPVRFTVSHEWHGGLWPFTDLYMRVVPDKAVGNGSGFCAMYRVVEDSKAARETVLAPKASEVLNLRMDWKGTGSKGRASLMPHLGKYRVRPLLVFRNGKNLEFVAGKEQVVKLEKANRVVASLPGSSR